MKRHDLQALPDDPFLMCVELGGLRPRCRFDETERCREEDDDKESGEHLAESHYLKGNR